jgi:glycogen operon protein
MKERAPANLEASRERDVRAGTPLPLGAHLVGDGVNFALFSRHATRVLLELYQRPDDGSATSVIELDPTHHRTGDIWHVWVRAVTSGQLYGYRVEGPYRPEDGHRFNAHKLLLDPFATALAGVRDWDFAAARGYDSSSELTDLSFSVLDNAGATPKNVFTNDDFDWEGDVPPRHPPSDTVIYETHVRGATIHPSSGVAYPGTFRGLTEKIPYFQD